MDNVEYLKYILTSEGFFKGDINNFKSLVQVGDTVAVTFLNLTPNFTH